MQGTVDKQATAVRRNPTIVGLAFLSLWFAGHAYAEPTPSPAAQTVAGAQDDGLQQVPLGGPGTFWVRPETDLRVYDRVALKPISVEYQGTPQHYQIDPLRRGVLLTERDRERLQKSFYDAFKTGLASGKGFGPASQPRPRMLWVTTSLVNVVVRNHRPPSTNELHLIDDYGEMTLRVEFSDSETGETVARFEEHRTLTPDGDFIGSTYSEDSYTFWMAIRANLSRWSELVRQRMYEQRTQTARF